MASKTRELAAKVIFETFKILKEAGGELRGREIVDKIGRSLIFDDWAKTIYEKTGNTRWQSILHFFTIDCIKAGFLRKDKGVWILTKEGEDAINLGPVGLLDRASELYYKWADAKKEGEIIKQDGEELSVGSEQLQKANLEQLEEKSIDDLRNYVINKNPYEFQDIVAALLRAMGYTIHPLFRLKERMVGWILLHIKIH